MTPARFEQAIRGQTAAALKVYDATPITEAWGVRQIASELHRLGSSMDFKVISGCLGSLVDSGLIARDSKGAYRRVPVRERIPAPDPQPQPEPMTTKEVTKPKDEAPSTKLGALAARLRSLADELDDAALAIDEQIEGMQADSRRLKQLQELLKG